MLERIRKIKTYRKRSRGEILIFVRGNKLFQNLKKVQLKNGLFTDEKSYNKHEREILQLRWKLELGKLYVYLRMILES